MTSPPDPWSDLRSRPHVDLVWADLPRGVRGLTDGERTIWLSGRLSQRERRCTLAHELVHLDWGHTEGQPPAIEAAVRRETARRLLPDVEQVARTLAWAPDLDEAAWELWVTADVLRARIDGLDDAERGLLDALLGRVPAST